jgi:ketosteroid isomerase-like protein
MKNVLAWALASSLLFACSNPKSADDKTDAKTDTTVAAPAKPQQAEFADAKYTEIGKRQAAALASGDIDSWLTAFADNAVYMWNNFDSLSGKAAISTYWKKRRKDVIDSMSFTNQIWLPIKVNQPQANEQTGIWLLNWQIVRSKYKTGKSMVQGIHTVMHFDANDKIDRVISYLDRAPINAATKKG